MKSASEILKLSAIAIGMAITISCNTILVSLFPFVRGSTLLLSLIAAGLCMAVVVLCFSELSSKFPGAIGIRAFSKYAFGNRFSVAATLFYVLMVLLIGGLEIYLCHLLLVSLFSPVLAGFALLILLGFVLFVNLRGYELSLQLQILMTVGVVLMMCWLSIWAQNGASLIPTMSTLSTAASAANSANDIDFLNAVPRALFLFIGIEWAVLHVTRHESFQRNLPIALMLAVVVIAGIYAQFAMALEARFATGALAHFALPHLELARVLNSNLAKGLVVIISLLAVLSSFNVGLSGAARILYSLGREAEIPAWFARLHGERLSPRNAMLFISACVLIIAPLMSFETFNSSLSQLLSFHLALIYACVLLAWLVFRRRKDHRGVRHAMHPILVFCTAIFLLIIAGGVFFSPENQVMRGILIGEVCALVVTNFFLFRFKNNKTQGHRA